MSKINLTKGQKIMLEKSNDTGNKLNRIAVALGWDEKEGTGHEFDLDASAVSLDANKQGVPPGLLYYGSSKNAQGMLSVFNDALVHTGDNLTGAGDGDDETINIELSKVPDTIHEILIVVNIYQAVERNQNFGMVNNSYCRVLNLDNNSEEIVHFDLNFDASTATGVRFVSFFRRNGEWAMSADQSEFSGGLRTIIDQYNLENA